MYTPAERKWTFLYDAKGNLTERRLLLGVDPDDTKDTLDRWTYDNLVTLKAIQTVLVERGTFEYDAGGNVTKVTEPSAAETNYTYTALDKPLTMHAPSGYEVLLKLVRPYFSKSCFNIFPRLHEEKGAYSRMDWDKSFLSFNHEI